MCGCHVEIKHIFGNLLATAVYLHKEKTCRSTSSIWIQIHGRHPTGQGQHHVGPANGQEVIIP